MLQKIEAEEENLEEGEEQVRGTYGLGPPAPPPCSWGGRLQDTGSNQTLPTSTSAMASSGASCLLPLGHCCRRRPSTFLPHFTQPGDVPVLRTSSCTSLMDQGLCHTQQQLAKI